MNISAQACYIWKLSSDWKLTLLIYLCLNMEELKHDIRWWLVLVCGLSWCIWDMSSGSGRRRRKRWLSCPGPGNPCTRQGWQIVGWLVARLVDICQVSTDGCNVKSWFYILHMGYLLLGDLHCRWGYYLEDFWEVWEQKGSELMALWSDVVLALTTFLETLARSPELWKHKKILPNFLGPQFNTAEMHCVCKHSSMLIYKNL